MHVLLTPLITQCDVLDRLDLAAVLRLIGARSADTLKFVMTDPAGEIGKLREEELPVIRVIVPPDPRGRVFEDDLDSAGLVFDGKLTPMLVWHEYYPVGRGWRSGWVLSYDTDGHGNPDDYIVGLGLPDVDAAVAQAREYLCSVGYPPAGWPTAHRLQRCAWRGSTRCGELRRGRANRWESPLSWRR